MIRDTRAADKAAIFEILRESGEFDAGSQDYVEAKLDAHLAAPGEALWLTAESAEDGEAVGVAYCIPEPVTMGTWNLLMLWTRRGKQGRGIGAALVTELERRLKAETVRLLLVETSGLPAFDTARVFYERQGFTHEATIRHFYAQDDHKLVYVKPLC